jgi:hypothetical protein
MKQIAVGFENSAAKCLVFHWLDRREAKRFLNVLLRRLSSYSLQQAWIQGEFLLSGCRSASMENFFFRA